MQNRASQGDCEAETLQIAVSRAQQLAGQFMYRPNLPVSLFRFTKRSASRGDV